MNNVSIEMFAEAAKEAAKSLKSGKVAYFTCPACKARALAKKEPSGRIRAYCQGCGIRIM